MTLAVLCSVTDFEYCATDKKLLINLTFRFDKMYEMHSDRTRNPYLSIRSAIFQCAR